MANILNQDFTEFITALNNAKAEYVLVGGYAVIFHSYNRTTGDLDVWVNPTAVNYRRLQKAFVEFGMSLFDMFGYIFCKPIHNIKKGWLKTSPAIPVAKLLAKESA